MKRQVLLILICILSRQFVFAQLCSGSLGDPIVNFTFGNTPAPLHAGVTNMQFTSLPCPNDGQYTVIDKTSNCFNGSWHTLNADHTGDANGHFMLVNASITPDDFYVDTVKGLCGNTTFEFAAWIANVQRPGACNGNPIRPNLTFRIETTAGVELIKYNTGDINGSFSPVWIQYGTFFKTPQGVSTVVLRITNNATGGCGNDLALDDITFRPCGPMVNATVRNQPSSNITICDDNTSAFVLDINSSNGFAGMSIQWQRSVDSGKTWIDIAGAQATSYTRQATGAGSYYYRAVVAETANFASAQCRVASTTAVITVNTTPVFTAKTLVGCTGIDLPFQTVNATGYTYLWTGPNNFSGNIYNPVLPKIKYADSGVYKVLVTTAAGCMNTDTFNLKVYPSVTATINAPSATICEGGSTALVASGGTIYQWSPATGLSNAQVANPVASPADTTVYKVTVANQYGCKDSAQTTVNVFQNPLISAGPDKKLFEGNSVLLDGSITGNMSSFYWSPNIAINNTTSLTPSVNPVDNTTYTLFVSPGMGCPVISDDVFVQVYKKLAVPNAFSPNGDGVNDTWVIRGLETYPGAVVRVYGRSGRLVFQSGASYVWDGSYHGNPVPIAAYYYVIELNNGTAPVSGWVMVLR